MSQIVDDLRQVAIEIKTETQVGGNTAARVGGAFERVADALEGTQQIEDMDAAVAAVQQAAAENEQTIQDIVNNLAVVQTTGQSTSDVMSQKAVTDELNEVKIFEESESLIFNKNNGKHPLNDTNYSITTQAGFVVGHRYRIVVALSANAPSETYIFLREVAAYKTPNIRLPFAIPQGNDSAEYIYEPVAATNYQYFNRYADNNTSVTTTFKVYEITQTTIKQEVEAIDEKLNNLDSEDITTEVISYSNSNGDFTWQTGNPSNSQSPTYPNKYFIIDVGKEIQKIKLSKSTSSYYFFLSAKVGNSYINIIPPATTIQDKEVDVSGLGYRFLYGLLYDQPSDSDAEAESIELEVSIDLSCNLKDIYEKISHTNITYFTNPIIGTDNPDPAVWYGEDGYWYLLATGNLLTRTMYRSANLVNWENTEETPFTDDAISTWSSLGYATFWAPEVVKVGNKWNLYLSSVQNPMHVFSSDHPTFGYEYVGVIANHVFGSTHENIDPCVRYDRDGTLWMFFDGATIGMYRVKLNENGTAILADTLEHVAGLPRGASGNTNRAKTFEGAYLYRRKGYWYLIVSAGRYEYSDYCLRVGRSATLDGTFVDKEGNPMAEGNASLLLSSTGTFYGTGHNGSIITDKNNKTWMLFHSHWTGASSSSARPVCISEVLWDENGWPYFENNTLTVKGFGPTM